MAFITNLIIHPNMDNSPLNPSYHQWAYQLKETIPHKFLQVLVLNMRFTFHRLRMRCALNCFH
jgi:hypothetical protein